MLWWICFRDTEAMQRGLSHFTSSPAGSRLHPPARDPCPLSGGCVWRTSPTRVHWKRETFQITKESAAGCMFVILCSDILFFPTAALDRQGATTPLKPSYHVCTSLTHSVPRGRVKLYGINMSTDWWSSIWRWWSFTSSPIWGDGCDCSWRVILNQQRTSCKLTLHKTTKPE